MSANKNLISWEEAIEQLKQDNASKKLVENCYYDDPLIAAAQRFYISEEWSSVRALLPSPPGRVVEFGAGRGLACYSFARDGWTVTAVEPNASKSVGAGAIRQLASDAEIAVNVVDETVENMSSRGVDFDVVYGRAVFHHAADLREFCRKAFEVLRPGGVFLMTREHVISSKEHLEAFLNCHPLHQKYGGEAAYTLEEYVKAISASGLKMKRVIGPYSSVINYYQQLRLSTTRCLRE